MNSDRSLFPLGRRLFAFVARVAISLSRLRVVSFRTRGNHPTNRVIINLTPVIIIIINYYYLFTLYCYVRSRNNCIVARRNRLRSYSCNNNKSYSQRKTRWVSFDRTRSTVYRSSSMTLRSPASGITKCVNAYHGFLTCSRTMNWIAWRCFRNIYIRNDNCPAFFPRGKRISCGNKANRRGTKEFLSFRVQSRFLRLWPSSNGRCAFFAEK